MQYSTHLTCVIVQIVSWAFSNFIGQIDYLRKDVVNRLGNVERRDNYGEKREISINRKWYGWSKGD